MRLISRDGRASKSRLRGQTDAFFMHYERRRVTLVARESAFQRSASTGCACGAWRGLCCRRIQAVIALANVKLRAGRVFRRPDSEAYKDRQRLSGGQIKTAWRGACKRAGLASTITPHDCRHTWATWLYAECHDLRQLMELGGRRTMSMVVRYAHVNPDHPRPAIDLLPGAQSGDNPGTKVAGNV